MAAVACDCNRTLCCNCSAVPLHLPLFVLCWARAAPASAVCVLTLAAAATGLPQAAESGQGGDRTAGQHRQEGGLWLRWVWAYLVQGLFGVRRPAAATGYQARCLLVRLPAPTSLGNLALCFLPSAPVRDLLEKNPHAKALQLPKLPPGGGSAGAGSSRGGAAGGKASGEGSAAAAGSEGGEEGGSAAAGAQRKRPAQKRKAAAEEAEKELVPDEQLPPRAVEMPVRAVKRARA